MHFVDTFTGLPRDSCRLIYFSPYFILFYNKTDCILYCFVVCFCRRRKSQVVVSRTHNVLETLHLVSWYWARINALTNEPLLSNSTSELDLIGWLLYLVQYGRRNRHPPRGNCTKYEILSLFTKLWEL